MTLVRLKKNINKQGRKHQSKKNCPYGPQKSSLKSLKIQNLTPLQTSETLLSNQIPGGKNVKKVQIDLQTTDIWSKKLNMPISINFKKLE